MKFPIVFILFFGFFAHAEKYAVHFSVEESGRDDRVVVNEGFKKLSQKGWKVESFFGRTELGRGASAKNFTEASFNRSLDDLIEKINSKKITSKDQVMISISSHGGVTLNELEVSTVNGNFSVDKKLQELIDAAEKNNVKLGVVAATCYSGHLQKLNYQNTCIITASQPDRVGYPGAHPAYSDAFMRHDDLEQAYLTPRNWSYLGQPMISTDAGQSAGKTLSYFADYLENIYEQPHLKPNICSDFRNSSNFLSDTKFLIFTILEGIDPKLKEQFNTLQEKLQKFREKYPEFRNQEKSKKEVCAEINKYKICSADQVQFWHWLDMANISLDELEKAKAKARNQEQTQWYAERIKQAEQERADLVKTIESSEFKKAFGIGYNISKKSVVKPISAPTSFVLPSVAELTSLSEDTAQLEKRLYQELYKKFSDPNRTNPCRDFKL